MLINGKQIKASYLDMGTMVVMRMAAYGDGFFSE